MFIWMKKLIVKKSKAAMNDNDMDKLIEDIVVKVDSGLTDAEERKHLHSFKKFIRPVIFAYLDKWAEDK